METQTFDTRTKRRYARERLAAMFAELQHNAFENLDTLLNNPERLPAEYLEGNYLLEKAIMDAVCVNRPYAPWNETTKKEFEKIRALI